MTCNVERAVKHHSFIHSFQIFWRHICDDSALFQLLLLWKNYPYLCLLSAPCFNIDHVITAEHFQTCLEYVRLCFGSGIFQPTKLNMFGSVWL